MVHRTEDWKFFRESTERCKIGYYKLREVPEGVEMKIMAGKLCFARVFDPDDKRSDTQKEIFSEMLKFCQTQGWGKVEESLNENYFFM